MNDMSKRRLIQSYISGVYVTLQGQLLLYNLFQIRKNTETFYIKNEYMNIWINVNSSS